MKLNIFCNFSTHNMMMIVRMLTSIFFRLDQWSPILQILYSLYYVFHKYGGVNVAVTNFMSHFYRFAPTKAILKLSKGNTGHAQLVGVISCRSTNCLVIYPMGPVYYCPGHPSNMTLSGYLKFYGGFQKVTSEPFENCDFFDRQGHSWISRYQTQTNLDYIHIKNFKFNSQRNRNFFGPTVCALSKKLSQLIHH